jgi:hypothetical protein
VNDLSVASFDSLSRAQNDERIAYEHSDPEGQQAHQQCARPRDPEAFLQPSRF